MKRRVLIAKALSHEPSVLFLDEPTAGVDVSLRHEMWAMVRELRATGVTIILTTHYIEHLRDPRDLHVRDGTHAAMTLGFLALCLTAIWWIFKTGYKLRS